MLVAKDDKHIEILERQQRYELRDHGRFDRLAFAMRALDILRPPKMKVVVYERVRELRIEQGIDHERGPDATWAMVGIPPHASREHIAYELAKLVGFAEQAWVTAILIRLGEVDG
jgi:hypothetical protein